MLVAAVELSGKEAFPFLDTSASGCVEVVLFFFSLQRGMDFFLFHLLVVFGDGGVSLGVFGCPV